MADLSAKAADLGGDDFLTSLLEAGTYDGKLYAVPYYAGARIVVYRKDLFEEAGIEIPTTLDEFLAAGVALKEANADTPNFSGIYLPGKNWYAVLSYIWEHGGDIAVQEDGEWVGQLDTRARSPGSSTSSRSSTRPTRRPPTATTPRTSRPSATARSA